MGAPTRLDDAVAARAAQELAPEGGAAKYNARADAAAHGTDRRFGDGPPRGHVEPYVRNPVHAVSRGALPRGPRLRRRLLERPPRGLLLDRPAHLEPALGRGVRPLRTATGHARLVTTILRVPHRVRRVDVAAGRLSLPLRQRAHVRERRRRKSNDGGFRRRVNTPSSRRSRRRSEPPLPRRRTSPTARTRPRRSSTSASPSASVL